MTRSKEVLIQELEDIFIKEKKCGGEKRKHEETVTQEKEQGSSNSHINELF